MRRKLFLITLLFTHILFSQKTELNNCEPDLKDEIYASHLMGRMFIDNHVHLKQQYYNAWQNGEVILKNGKRIANVNIRYNGFLDELLWVRDKDHQAVIVDKSNVSGFILKNEVQPDIYFKKIETQELQIPEKEDIYVQILTKGTFTIYAFRKIGYYTYTDEMFEDFYYIVEHNGKKQKILPRRSLVKKAFPNYKEEIKNTLHSNFLMIRNEHDFVRLFSILNEKIQSSGEDYSR